MTNNFITHKMIFFTDSMTLSSGKPEKVLTFPGFPGRRELSLLLKYSFLCVRHHIEESQIIY